MRVSTVFDAMFKNWEEEEVGANGCRPNHRQSVSGTQCPTTCSTTIGRRRGKTLWLSRRPTYLMRGVHQYPTWGHEIESWHCKIAQRGMGLDVKKLKWKDLSTGQSDDNNVSFEMVERGPIKLTNPLKPILQGNSRLRGPWEDPHRREATQSASWNWSGQVRCFSSHATVRHEILSLNSNYVEQEQSASTRECLQRNKSSWRALWLTLATGESFTSTIHITDTYNSRIHITHKRGARSGI